MAEAATAKRGVQDRPREAGSGKAPWACWPAAAASPCPRLALQTGSRPPGVYHSIHSHSVMHDPRKVKKPWWCAVPSAHIYKDKYIYMYVSYSTGGPDALLDQAKLSLLVWVLCCISFVFVACLTSS